jgi:hypothetical protein
VKARFRPTPGTERKVNSAWGEHARTSVSPGLESNSLPGECQREPRHPSLNLHAIAAIVARLRGDKALLADTLT